MWVDIIKTNPSHHQEINQYPNQGPDHTND